MPTQTYKTVEFQLTVTENQRLIGSVICTESGTPTQVRIQISIDEKPTLCTFNAQGIEQLAALIMKLRLKASDATTPVGVCAEHGYYSQPICVGCQPAKSNAELLAEKVIS